MSMSNNYENPAPILFGIGACAFSMLVGNFVFDIFSDEPKKPKTTEDFYQKVCLQNVAYWTRFDRMSVVYTADGAVEVCNLEELQ
jgi:hypothetical protein